MAALNHAVMIPGLVLILAIFWLWLPILGVTWCVRRAAGRPRTDTALHSGHRPHAGFAPPPDADYHPYAYHDAAQRAAAAAAAPFRTGRHHFHNAAQKREYEAVFGVSPEEQRRRQARKYAVAAQRRRRRRHGGERGEGRRARAASRRRRRAPEDAGRGRGLVRAMSTVREGGSGAAEEVARPDMVMVGEGQRPFRSEQSRC